MVYSFSLFHPVAGGVCTLCRFPRRFQAARMDEPAESVTEQNVFYLEIEIKIR